MKSCKAWNIFEIECEESFAVFKMSHPNPIQILNNAQKCLDEMSETKLTMTHECCWYTLTV